MRNTSLTTGSATAKMQSASQNRWAVRWLVSLAALHLVCCTSCNCDHRVPRATCYLPGCTAGCADPHNYCAYVSAEAGGYHPVCWQRWPQNWCGCPLADWASSEDEPVTPERNAFPTPQPEPEQLLPGQLLQGSPESSRRDEPPDDAAAVATDAFG